jgi:(p)ppGpp synthase/HD superfamily hydrolase
MNLLEKAILIAVKAHQGQVDKGGHPYILHPLAVMNRVKSSDAKIIAVLHDVLEDTEMTAEDLQKEGFPQEIIDAICAVTRMEEETYEAFLQRIAKNALAVEVKLADIAENRNLSRIPNPTAKDKQRIKKYEQARAFLTAVLPTAKN